MLVVAVAALSVELSRESNGRGINRVLIKNVTASVADVCSLDVRGMADALLPEVDIHAQVGLWQIIR